MVTICGRITLIALLLFPIACGGEYRNHGYMPSKVDVDALVVDVDNREKIIEAIRKRIEIHQGFSVSVTKNQVTSSIPAP